ncbi:MAG: endonuclease/exonuclease/phosphatase family protein [Cyanobacteria bacterium J06641_5]
MQRASCIYVVLFAGCNGLPLTPLGQLFWPLQVIQALGLWLYLPIVVLGIANCFWSRRALVWLLVPLAAFAIDYGWCFWPNRPIVPASPPLPSLRFMTWNLNFRNTDVAVIAACVETEQPDAIVLQEMNLDVKANLPARLQARYPYQQIVSAYAPIQFAELAIFSRFPIESAEEAALNRVQQVQLHVGDRQLMVYNVHIPVPRIRSWQLGLMPLPTGFEPADRQQGFGQLWQHLQHTDNRSTIVLGDFNSADRAANYWQLRRLLRDAFRDRGWGFGLTYPAQPKVGPLPWDPIVRIDYIFHGEGLRAIAARTGESPISDHRYVVADLQLLNEPR